MPSDRSVTGPFPFDETRLQVVRPFTLSTTSGQFALRLVLTLSTAAVYTESGTLLTETDLPGAEPRLTRALPTYPRHAQHPMILEDARVIEAVLFETGELLTYRTTEAAREWARREGGVIVLLPVLEDHRHKPGPGSSGGLRPVQD
jgi:hypothetical protein